eukprot:CAMPEP_0206139930 /NCGR_PEP_ID=MMETSP1473-20131121/7815_1 /ASSEMBLY_ACC=CAM_ASM_001109 /TAXON_ID=1461547 /ORGANISM="Stichococcus sp, Strain RCC1054" /LENGTH=364 /DNA_ID=CAMNT_0053533881 /DNA_START=282 /DNA_END=1376 /DNA_ORIENTATION=-
MGMGMPGRLPQPPLLLLPLVLALVAATGAQEEKLIGWKGETYHEKRQVELGDVAGEAFVKDVRGTGDYNSTKPWVEVISWHPRTFVYHNFLSYEECDHLVAMARPQMRQSTVVGADKKPKTAKDRTSFGTFLRRNFDPIVSRLEQRLADWTQLPVLMQEDMQILRYGVGQFYGAHFDSLIEVSPRVATVLIYLADTEEGGETAFPQDSQWADPALAERYGPFSDCAQGHVAFKPKKGAALLFYSVQPDMDRDESSMHTGCPVVKGTKWSATKWIHSLPFRPESFDAVPEGLPPNPEDCVNQESRCEDWAKEGECEKNPTYMIGQNYQLGGCRLACKACDACAEGDLVCRAHNRLRAGYLPLDAD